MSVLQYVGARYVPKLFDDGNGGMEWKADTYYEPLTIVTYNNASYISRTPVPANIGNPAINSDFWALSGNFNAQVADLSDRLQVTESRSNVAYMSRIVVFGDSYSDLSNTPSLGQSLKQLYGDRIEIIARDGYAFTNGQWIDLVNAYSGEANSVSTVLFIGGSNDVSALYDALLSSVQTTIAAAHEKFPNAAVYVGCIGGRSGSTQSDSQFYLENVVRRAYINGCGGSASYIPGSEYPMMDVNNFRSDGIHPNQSGVDALTDMLAAFIRRGTYKLVMEQVTTSINLLAPFNEMTGTFMKQKKVNEWVEMQIGRPNFSLVKSTDITDGSLMQMGTLENSLYNPMNEQVIDAFGQAKTQSGQTVPVHIELLVQQNRIYIRIYRCEIWSDSNVIQSVTNIIIFPCCRVLPTPFR